MTPEGKVKEALKKALKACGAYYHFPVQNGMGAPSLDCIVCYKGVYCAIETKASGKKPTARQTVTMEAIRAAGGTALYIDSVEQAKEISWALESAHQRVSYERDHLRETPKGSSP